MLGSVGKSVLNVAITFPWLAIFKTFKQENLNFRLSFQELTHFTSETKVYFHAKSKFNFSKNGKTSPFQG